MFFLIFFFYSFSYQNKSYSNLITKWKWTEYDQLHPNKTIENISCEEISNNFNLLISQIILKKYLHISRRWVYGGRQSNDGVLYVEIYI